MISTESAFNKLGIDAVTGVELMDWLGLSPIDFSDPARFGRFQSIIDYMKQFSTDTQRFLIRKVVNGKNVDKLSYMWEYTELLKNKKAAEESIEKTKAESSALNATADPVLSASFAARENEAREMLASVTREMEIYEK